MRKIILAILLTLFIGMGTSYTSSAKPRKTKSTSSSSTSSSKSTSSKTVRVKSYTKKDGTHVKAHTRSAPKKK